MHVVLFSRLIFKSKFMTSTVLYVSRSPVGSSKKEDMRTKTGIEIVRRPSRRISGSFAKERAMVLNIHDFFAA